MTTFKKTNSEQMTGTSLQDYTTANYHALKRVLGSPSFEGSGDGKISTEWILEDEDGNVATLYDYKETDLYSQSLPSVEEFRDRPQHEWHVGAHDKATAARFIIWLVSELLK